VKCDGSWKPPENNVGAMRPRAEYEGYATKPSQDNHQVSCENRLEHSTIRLSYAVRYNQVVGYFQISINTWISGPRTRTQSDAKPCSQNSNGYLRYAGYVI